ncbi:MAG: sn-glycerol-3-phosphate ABC transporter ATP-binding protein UgpC [Bacillota bacterium]|nr:sn-glycerol-3-phosphate ABC transporter ATP-binding protein UgpC [Bacillota bacterium]
MATISLKHLRKVYESGNCAVEDFNIEVADGEFIVLVGPSGCGKSTTLRMVAGLESITDGEFWIGDKDVTRVAAKDRDIAMVFQNYALYGNMSIYQNMGFSLMLRKEDPEVIHKKVMPAAKMLGLEDQLNKKPRELSGGQRQRVAMGRAIVRTPKVFLFDEPLSNLDAKLRSAMRREIKLLHHRLGTTMVYVTHDQTEALTLADRIVVMSMGRVQQIGTPYEIYNNPANIFVGNFIGNPPMNFFEGVIKGDKFVNPHFEVKLNEENQKLVAAYKDSGKKIVFGLRPENFVKGKELTFNVELTEHLGQNSLVHGDINGAKCILKLAGWQRLDKGDVVSIGVRQEKIRFYDGETGDLVKLDNGEEK